MKGLSHDLPPATNSKASGQASRKLGVLGGLQAGGQAGK